MVNAAYFHVPFCKNICSYCNFTKLFYDEKMCDEYLIKLENECSKYNGQIFKSVYLGGGTPTSLNEAQLDSLLLIASKYKSNQTEFCIETNPETMNDKKIDLLVKYGINRVSIGVQTFNDKYLNLLNRKHRKNDVINLISTLKRKGISNISVDLIFGLPYQKEKELIEDLNEFIKLDINHISCYPLVIEDNTILKNNGVIALSDDEVYHMYSIINNVLKENGFVRYEISNFSRPGYESKHNLVYWHDEEYFGFGPGASGYVDGIRYDNTKSINEYNKGVTRITEKIIAGEEKELEYIMLNLRLKDGINLNEYKDIFGYDFIDRYEKQIKKLVKEGLLHIENSQCYIEEKGLYISNYIISELTINLNY